MSTFYSFDLVVLCVGFFIWFGCLVFELFEKKTTVAFFSKMSCLWINYLMKWSFYLFGGWMLKKKLFDFHLWWISPLQSLFWSWLIVMTSHMLSGIIQPLWSFFLFACRLYTIICRRRRISSDVEFYGLTLIFVSVVTRWKKLSITYFWVVILMVVFDFSLCIG